MSPHRRHRRRTSPASGGPIPRSSLTCRCPPRPPPPDAATRKWVLVGKPTVFNTVFELIEFYGHTPTTTGDGVCLL